MLCAMSYNVWILVCVALGAGLGYFFVRPIILHWLEKREKDNQKNEDKWTELKGQFINGVNEKEESKQYPLTKLHGEKIDTCA